MGTRRKYLLWCSAKNGVAAAELYGENRVFDVAVHDYAPWMPGPRGQRSEYWIQSEGTEKLETAGANMPSLMQDYQGFAFLDEDLEISTKGLNSLFLLGATRDFNLYQPALTPDSCCSWPYLRQQAALMREVPMVEVMCPFFSRWALEKCLWSFELNHSGWGLDTCIWPKLAGPCHVIDATPIRHPGPFRDPVRRIMRNGLTAWQEYAIVKNIRYDGPSPW